MKICSRIKIFRGGKWYKTVFFKDIVALYFLTFIVILPLVCWNLRHTPYEVFFRRNETLEKTMLKLKNQERFKQSLAVLNKTNTAFPGLSSGYAKRYSGGKMSMTHHVLHNGGVIREHQIGIAVTIITVSRNKILMENYRPHYLVQTVAAFLQTINQTADDIPVDLSICNVDRVPKSHTDMNYMPKWITVFQRFSKPNHSKLSYDALIDKEKEDYIFCLEKALEKNMTFALLVEDDALPHSELFHVLRTKIISLFHHERRRKSLENVLFVKLYHPERLLSFLSLEYERLPELFSLTCLLTGILVPMYIKLRPNINTSKMNISFAFLIYSACVFISIGRQNIMQTRRFSHHLFQMTPGPGCCTPAMLFPRSGGRIVIEYLKSVRCGKEFAKDMALAKLIYESRNKSRLIQPNLFQHIGHFSSLRSGFINPFFVQ